MRIFADLISMAIRIIIASMIQKNSDSFPWNPYGYWSILNLLSFFFIIKSDCLEDSRTLGSDTPQNWLKIAGYREKNFLIPKI